MNDRLDAEGPQSIQQAYDRLVHAGTIAHDNIQADVVSRFDALKLKLESQKPATGLSRLWSPKPEPVKGLYIQGSVGRGKSFLMDLFFAHLDVERKRRVHFHEFMDQMHNQIARFRAEQASAKNADPVEAVVRALSADVRVLCFDEFHVTDITNAMLLGRLFTRLWHEGMTIIATSNVAPDNLYENGLNRQLILPFIADLKAQCDVLQLDGPTDYRREKLSGRQIFYIGDKAETGAAMDELWQDVTGGHPAERGSVMSLGREIVVPDEAMGAARFAFTQLCEQPLGARDYLAIAQAYHTLMIDGVPQFSRQNSNAAKRFILLIDTLYERSVKVLSSFAVPLDQLGADKDTAFEFQRCVSRLIEMQSDGYLARGVARRIDA